MMALMMHLSTIQEMLAEEKMAGQETQTRQYNIADMMDDPELQNLHAERIAKMQAEHEKRLQMQHKGHGQVTEITEGEFLEVVTKTEKVVVHFFHRDFERCKIMDKHLVELARKHFKTRFTRISAPVRSWKTVSTMAYLRLKMYYIHRMGGKSMVLGSRSKLRPLP